MAARDMVQVGGSINYVKQYILAFMDHVNDEKNLFNVDNSESSLNSIRENKKGEISFVGVYPLIEIDEKNVIKVLDKIYDEYVNTKQSSLEPYIRFSGRKIKIAQFNITSNLTYVNSTEKEKKELEKVADKLKIDNILSFSALKMIIRVFSGKSINSNPFNFWELYNTMGIYKTNINIANDDAETISSKLSFEGKDSIKYFWESDENLKKYLSEIPKEKNFIIDKVLKLAYSCNNGNVGIGIMNRESMDTFFKTYIEHDDYNSVLMKELRYEIINTCRMIVESNSCPNLEKILNRINIGLMNEHLSKIEKKKEQNKKQPEKNTITTEEKKTWEQKIQQIIKSNDYHLNLVKICANKIGSILIFCTGDKKYPVETVYDAESLTKYISSEGYGASNLLLDLMDYNVDICIQLDSHTVKDNLTKLKKYIESNLNEENDKLNIGGCLNDFYEHVIKLCENSPHPEFNVLKWKLYDKIRTFIFTNEEKSECGKRKFVKIPVIELAGQLFKKNICSKKKISIKKMLNNIHDELTKLSSENRNKNTNECYIKKIKDNLEYIFQSWTVFKKIKENNEYNEENYNKLKGYRDIIDKMTW